MTPTLPASPLDDIGFDTLFDAAPAPCLVLSMQLTILAANAAYLAVACRDRASIVGLNIFDAFPDNPDDPHADGVANLRVAAAGAGHRPARQDGRDALRRGA